MKLFRRFRRAPQPGLVSIPAQGEILVHDVEIFGTGGKQNCRRFVERVLTLVGVQSITVDRRQSSAIIRYSAFQHDPKEILRRLGAALSDDTIQPQDHVRGLVKGVDERVFTLFRSGDANSTSDVAIGPAPVRGIRRLGFFALATGSFVMSFVGIVVPGIPTVPFVLLTSYYLIRCSPPLNERLLRTRTFGTLIRDWQEHGGMRPRVKIATLSIMMAMAAVSLLVADLSAPLLVVVVLLICLGTYTILRLPTVLDSGDLQTSHGGSGLSLE